MSTKPQKIALIVDDSPTARYFLSKRLMQHDVRAEMAESAESALEFLSKSRPDVIFMDHMMPGMDGFQAVRAIKSNPATATIPVMMYTSKAGELYLGQARALGAVGVLPKKIRSAHLAEILKSLHLISDSRETDADVDDSGVDRKPEAAPEVSDVAGNMDPADWDRLHRRLCVHLKPKRF